MKAVMGHVIICLLMLQLLFLTFAHGRDWCHGSCDDCCTTKCKPDGYLDMMWYSCDVCKDGYYTERANNACLEPCPDACTSCSTLSTCSQCEPGYYNSGSVTNCSLSCPSSCLACSSATHCMACREGYYSDGKGDCLSCPVGCATCSSARQCSSCRPGFTGKLCDSCIAGYYGPDCNTTCPANCQTCSSASSCQLCYDRFTGDTCEQCVDGKYGTVCNRSCLSNCKNNKCDRSNGTCSACLDDAYLHSEGQCYPCPGRCTSCTNSSYCSNCKLGFTSALCDSCVARKHGDNCDLDCPVNCLTCSSYSTCELCKPGFTGALCESSIVLIGAIAIVGGILGLTILTSLAGGILSKAKRVWQNRRKRHMMSRDRKMMEEDGKYDEPIQGRVTDNCQARAVPPVNVTDEDQEYDEIPELDQKPEVYNTLNLPAGPPGREYSALDLYEQPLSQYEKPDTQDYEQHVRQYEIPV